MCHAKRTFKVFSSPSKLHYLNCDGDAVVLGVRGSDTHRVASPRNRLLLLARQELVEPTYQIEQDLGIAFEFTVVLYVEASRQDLVRVVGNSPNRSPKSGGWSGETSGEKTLSDARGRKFPGSVVRRIPEIRYDKVACAGS